jgi:hypothetical protein
VTTRHNPIAYAIFIFALSSLFSKSAAGQPWPPATFLPASPTERDHIQARFTVPEPCVVTTTNIVNGTTIRENLLLSCAIGPPAAPSLYSTAFGPLPANTYRYEIYYDFQDGNPPQLRSQQP